MEEKILKMHFRDRSLMTAFILFLWVVLIYTMTVVSKLAPTATVRLIALTVGMIAGLSVTSASIAVLAHLKKHRNELYSEDIMGSNS
ncbi:hypothetical protein [Desulfosporosinus sp. Sb-LF]|uniref:hypothetical protein n=1 Tax=Desulfosporosinus sp. Sb-LF TaxID=2560027 RepID=UPI00107F3BAD|nr:hypothetical protein [Desulfosporosinus sp. Sb-LF]TGE31829.1 hypothetical protein E4K68_14110 [Desulfosporosinus sp. Sb-LF]